MLWVGIKLNKQDETPSKTLRIRGFSRAYVEYLQPYNYVGRNMKLRGRVKMRDEMNTEGLTITEQPELSGWKCYLFGSKPEMYPAFMYTPNIHNVPNWFVRYMMKICLGCTWVKGEE